MACLASASIVVITGYSFQHFPSVVEKNFIWKVSYILYYYKFDKLRYVLVPYALIILLSSYHPVLMLVGSNFSVIVQHGDSCFGLVICQYCRHLLLEVLVVFSRASFSSFLSVLIVTCCFCHTISAALLLVSFVSMVI